jgi:hypothetical protein
MLTTTATAIIIVRNKGHRNEFSLVSHPANIAVIFIDGEDDEIDRMTFAAHEGAKARDYALKMCQDNGIKIAGLSDFDAGIWH